MRGKRCARRYMQTLPCTSPNSADIYRRKCREHFQRSHFYMCCSTWLLPHFNSSHSCLHPKSDTIGRAQLSTRAEPLETMQMCGASAVVCLSMRSIISLRHFALAVCMIFWAIQTVGSPATRRQSLSGEPRDLRTLLLSQPHIQDIPTISHHIYPSW